MDDQDRTACGSCLWLGCCRSPGAVIGGSWGAACHSVTWPRAIRSLFRFGSAGDGRPAKRSLFSAERAPFHRQEKLGSRLKSENGVRIGNGPLLKCVSYLMDAMRSMMGPRWAVGAATTFQKRRPELKKTEWTHYPHRIVLVASQRSTSKVDRPAGQTAEDSAGKLAREIQSTEMTTCEGAAAQGGPFPIISDTLISRLRSQKKVSGRSRRWTWVRFAPKPGTGREQVPRHIRLVWRI